MSSKFRYVQKDDLLRLTLRDRVSLGLHICRQVFRLFTPDYVEASCQADAMALAENYLRTGVYDELEARVVRNKFDKFCELYDDGPYDGYGSEYGFAAMSLLDEMAGNDGSTIASIGNCGLAFAGVQMFRQNLSPFDPIVFKQYGEYHLQLEHPVYESANTLYKAITEAGAVQGVDLNRFLIDITLPSVPVGLLRQVTLAAPPEEYAYLKHLGLAVA